MRRTRSAHRVALTLTVSLLPAAAGAQEPDSTAGRVAGRPIVGLALSGGSAKGFAHIAVLKELERAGVRVDVVAGTSMGSVIGGLYAIGLGTDSIEALVRGADWGEVLGDGAERERRFLHQRRFDERAVLTLPVQGRSVRLASGAIIGSNIVRLAERATWRAATVRSFDQLPRPFAAVATDIETGDAVTLRGGVLSEVMRASSGIPGAIEPLEIDGRLLVDGALSRNLPASDARALGADVVVCSDVSDPLATSDELGSLVDVMDQVMTISMRRSIVAERAECDVLVRPDVTGISGLAFDRLDDWLERGQAAAELHRAAFRDIAYEQVGGRVTVPNLIRLPPDLSFLPDSVRVAGIRIEGATRQETETVVLKELGLAEGAYVTSAGLASSLSDIDATGLFGLVRYRLDGTDDLVRLTVHVEERPKDRVGVGLRYDDERRAALLFTGTFHNLLRYGSVTRFDLRVGEETRARAAYLRRYGITGRFEGASSIGWSQSELRLPGPAGAGAGIELTTLQSSLGLVGERTTFFGLEVTGEWSVTDHQALPNVLLVSAAAVFDHESLDRIDFPTAGTDATMRWEWGGTNLTGGEGFSVLSGSTRFFIPLSGRVTADLGGFVGLARGRDLPVHRQFFVGGQHASAVFASTQPLFHGVDRQEMVGLVAQVARAGLRVRMTETAHLRLGVDVGGTTDVWEFPVPDPIVGWAGTLGVNTLVGPFTLELGKASGRGARLSVGVGRLF